MKEIGKKIRERREELGITQGFIAKKTGVTTRSIYNVEQGKDSTTLVVAKICEVLGMELIVKDKEE